METLEYKKQKTKTIGFLKEEIISGMKENDQRPPLVSMTAKEWIAQLRDYRGLKCRRVILENELTEARRDFDDARIDACKRAIAALDAELYRLEEMTDCYAPSDARPYKGSSYGLERAFFRCRYILGLSLEKTAELMDVSRATVFRLSRYIDASML